MFQPTYTPSTRFVIKSTPGSTLNDLTMEHVWPRTTHSLASGLFLKVGKIKPIPLVWPLDQI